MRGLTTRRAVIVTMAVLAVGGIFFLVVLGESAPQPEPTGIAAPNSPPAAADGVQAPIEDSLGADPQRPVTASPALNGVPLEVAVAQSADRTEMGARDAAVAILELTEEAVLMAPQEAAAFQRPFSTLDFADEAAARTEEQLVELRQTIPEGITLRLAPIGNLSVSDGEGWIVSIWFVEAITIGSQGVVDDWRTATYTMRWEDQAWKVAAFDSSRGPMPGRGTQPASATPIQFEALLAGFDDAGLN